MKNVKNKFDTVFSVGIAALVVNIVLQSVSPKHMITYEGEVLEVSKQAL